MSLHVKHPLVLVIICTKYEDNPSITADVIEWTQKMSNTFTVFAAKLWLNDLKVIGQWQKSLNTHRNDPFGTSDIYRVDTRCATFFTLFIANSWLNDNECICQGQKLLHTTQFLMLEIFFAKYGVNQFRTLCAAEWAQKHVPYSNSFITKSCLNGFEDIHRRQKSMCVTHPLMLVSSVSNNMGRIHPKL